MRPAEQDPDNQENKPRIYNSPSRMSAVTPVRSALRSSNKNAILFLDRLKQLDKFKERVEELRLKRNNNKENDPHV